MLSVPKYDQKLGVNLVSYYGGWGTAVESSTIINRHCTVTGMNIDTYADQNNIKYPNKIKLIKLSVHIHFERKKNMRECMLLSWKVCVIFTISE